jgi:uncharacterized protein YdiU (UPF0061 family)
MHIPFDNTYARLPERFFTKQAPAQVPDPKLIRLNVKLAENLGMNIAWLESPEGVAALSGNAVAAGSDPIAQAYAGHQFGGFVPQLGDGRAILLGEVVGKDGKRYDVQLKGSGRTAFSRGGDGKSALGPVLREYIVSEAMTALGVRATRALAAVATGQLVLRQEGAIPGGVFTRIAASHIRVGTFQYFMAREDVDGIRTLADYVIARHYPALAAATQPYAALLEAVALAQADLIAHWMSLGFIHGVMNTDNTSVSGETIDFGPCAFMEAFHPKCVFSSIDARGRYAWGNQPEIGLWNMARFAETLLPLLAENQDEAVKMAEAILEKYPPRYTAQYLERFQAKFGLPADSPETMVQSGLEMLAEQEVDFTLFFRHLTRVAAGEDSKQLESLFRDQESFFAWLAKWREATRLVPRVADMRAANPILIPRNHRVEQAIQAGYQGDYAPFNRLVDALANPYTEQPEYCDLEATPLPEEVVHQTFCGT